MSKAGRKIRLVTLTSDSEYSETDSEPELPEIPIITISDSDSELHLSDAELHLSDLESNLSYMDTSSPIPQKQEIPKL